MPYENALKRATIGAAIARTLRGMYENPERSVRGALDFLESYAGEVPDQARLFRLRRILEENRNWIFRFLLSMMKYADFQTVKTVSTNVLFNRVPFLNERRGAGEGNGPWAAAGVDDLDAVQKGKQQGIYFYVLYGRNLLQHRDSIFKLCRQNRDCVFYLVADGQEIDENFAAGTSGIRNIFVSVRLDAGTPENELYRRADSAFQLLKKYRCMRGFSAFVNGAAADELCSRRFLDFARRSGCLLGWYFCRNGAHPDYGRKVRETVKQSGMFKRLPALLDAGQDRAMQACLESGGRGYLFYGKTGLHARYSLAGNDCHYPPGFSPAC